MFVHLSSTWKYVSHFWIRCMNPAISLLYYALKHVWLVFSLFTFHSKKKKKTEQKFGKKLAQNSVLVTFFSGMNLPILLFCFVFVFVLLHWIVVAVVLFHECNVRVKWSKMQMMICERVFIWALHGSHIYVDILLLLRRGCVVNWGRQVETNTKIHLVYLVDQITTFVTFDAFQFIFKLCYSLPSLPQQLLHLYIYIYIAPSSGSAQSNRSTYCRCLLIYSIHILQSFPRSVSNQHLHKYRQIWGVHVGIP